MSKNYKGLTAQQIMTVQSTPPSSKIFYLDYTYNITKVVGTDMIDLEKLFEQGQTISMHNFNDGDIVQVINENGKIVDTGMYFGKKRINNMHHWLILSGKGYRELNMSYHTLVKSESIKE
tara:strand:- start:301 stop:660 length:360 start_codon:yes stop_codon:yes gene_type:complete